MGSFPLPLAHPLVFCMPEKGQKTPNCNTSVAAAILAADRICLASFPTDSLLTAHSSSEIIK